MKVQELISQARILVSLATQQDKEVGDGTTSVVLLASELLRRANELVRNKIHPTTVITGYRSVELFFALCGRRVWS